MDGIFSVEEKIFHKPLFAIRFHVLTRMKAEEAYLSFGTVDKKRRFHREIFIFSSLFFFRIVLLPMLHLVDSFAYGVSFFEKKLYFCVTKSLLFRL